MISGKRMRQMYVCFVSDTRTSILFNEITIDVKVILVVKYQSQRTKPSKILMSLKLCDEVRLTLLLSKKSMP